MNGFEWSTPSTVEQAISELSPAVALKAGGVDLLDRLKEGLEAPKRVVNLRQVPGLDGLTDDPTEGLTVGPLVTLAKLAADQTVRARYAALAQAVGGAATPQIRNMATVGGNLLQRPRCWYFRAADLACAKKGGDRCLAKEGENAYHAIFGNGLCAIVHPSAAATALVALGGRVVLQGPKGKRELAVEDFLRPPEEDVLRENVLAADEVLIALRLPPPAPGARSAYFKQKEKESFDWPIADVAVQLELDGKLCRKASVVLGAAAPVPYRAKGAEAALAGKSLDAATVAKAVDAALQGATPLSQNAYKVPVFKAILRRTLLAAGGAA